MATASPDPTPARATLSLDVHELELLIDALDSHMYWELSDRDFRSSGYVLDPGAHDAEQVNAIDRSRALSERLDRERVALAALTLHARE
jgi:hypothetical protein